MIALPYPDVVTLLNDSDWPSVASASGIEFGDESALAYDLPAVRPSKTLCVGLNYRSHAQEVSAKTPDYPMLFAKFPDSLTGASSPICLPRVSEAVDWEVELGIVIGSPARRVSVDHAAVKLHAPRQASVVDEPAPMAQPGEVIIRIDATGLCGSDLSTWLGHHPFRHPPVVLGHEAAGTVVAAAADVSAISVGARVALCPLIPCGRCPPCLRGDANLCLDRRVPGDRLGRHLRRLRGGTR